MYMYQELTVLVSYYCCADTCMMKYENLRDLR